jgi:putative inorganic carbon (hco3(-)) transporter
MQPIKTAPFNRHVDLPTLPQAKQLCVTLLLSAVIGVSHFLTAGHNQQRMVQIAFFAVFSLLALVSGRVSGLFIEADQRGLRWSLGGFFALGTVSSLVALSPRHALLELSMLLMLLMLAICIAREVARNSVVYLPLVLKICAITCLAYAIQIVAVYLSALAFGTQPDVNAFAPGFSNYRFLNHAQTISLPLLVLLCLLVKPGGGAKWGMFSLAAFWWTLLFVTSGRGTVVGLVAGCALAWFLRRRHAHALCKMMLLTALAGLGIYAIFFALIPVAVGFEPFGAVAYVVQRTVDDPASMRGGLWWRAIELIVAHPWLGAGPLHYAHYAIDVQFAHPHDWVLQIGAEWGVPALLCLCSAIGFSMRSLVRTAALISTHDARNQDMLAAWIVMGGAILVDGLVSGLIVMPVSQLLIVLYIGCAAGWSLSFKVSVRAPRQPASGRLVAACLLLLAVLGLAMGIAPDIASQSRPTAMSGKEAAWYNGIGHPRIWLHGHF